MATGSGFYKMNWITFNLIGSPSFLSCFAAHSKSIEIKIEVGLILYSEKKKTNKIKIENRDPQIAIHFHAL